MAPITWAIQLGNDVGQRKAPARPQTQGHRRIEMTAGDVGDGIGHGQEAQAEGKRDTDPSDTQFRKRCSEHGAAAAAEYEPERPEEFGRQTFAKRHGLSPTPIPEAMHANVRIVVERTFKVPFCASLRETIDGYSDILTNDRHAARFDSTCVGAATPLA